MRVDATMLLLVDAMIILALSPQIVNNRNGPDRTGDSALPVVPTQRKLIPRQSLYKE